MSTFRPRCSRPSIVASEPTTRRSSSPTRPSPTASSTERSARMARRVARERRGKGDADRAPGPRRRALADDLLRRRCASARCVTPISTLTTPPELAHILRTSDAQILIGARRFLRHDFVDNLVGGTPGLRDGRAERAAAPGAPTSVRSGSTTPTVSPGPARSTSSSRRADAPSAPDAALLAAVEQEVSPSDDAVRRVHVGHRRPLPKAVVHSQWAAARQAASARADLPHDELTTARCRCSRRSGWVASPRRCRCCARASTLVYPSSPDIEDVLDMIERHDVTYVVIWQTLAKFRAAAIARGIDVDNIRGTGAPPRDERGELIPPGLRANLFGMSETFSAHSAEPINRRMPDEQGGASGRAVNGIERRVVDPETGVRGAARRGRRAAAARRRAHDRLLQGRPARRVHARWLLPDARSRADRCRRLPVLRRSHAAT